MLNLVLLILAEMWKNSCPKVDSWKYSSSWTRGGENFPSNGRWVFYESPWPKWLKGLHNLQPEGIWITITPPEVGEEEVDDVHETVAYEVPKDGGHVGDTREEAMHEVDAFEVHSKIEKAGKVHLEAEEAGKEHPSTPITTTASLPDPSPPKVSHALIASVALGSSSPSRHYTRLKSPKTSQAMIGLQAPNQLSFDNHPFF